MQDRGEATLLTWPSDFELTREALADFAHFDSPEMQTEQRALAWYITPNVGDRSLAVELLGTPGAWAYFVGSEVIAETGNAGNADAEVLTAIWAVAFGGGAKYRIGRKVQWVIGDHERIANSLGHGRHVELLETREPWGSPDMARLPVLISPLRDDFCQFPSIS